MDLLKQRRVVSGLLLFFCVLGAAVRVAVAYNGGIWADEGAFLVLVGSPSWGSMIEFLRLHESHPPFFYALMRLWMSVAGSADTIALALPVAIGIALVPAVYFVASRMFSSRAALLTTLLAAMSPPLVDYSTQFRPYGLLPFLTLGSCYALVVSIEKGGARRWGAYVLATSILLYTHNWGWLVLFGQFAAAMTLLIRPVAAQRSRFARELIFSWLLVGLLYAPWLTTLLYQTRHAGHAGVMVDGALQAIGFALFGVPSALVMVLLGSLAYASMTMWITTIAFMIAVAFVMSRSDSAPSEGLQAIDAGTVGAQRAIALRLFTVVPVVSVLAAILLSSRSDLLIPRCLAMLTPLVLIVGAHWVDRARFSLSRTARAKVPVVLLAGVVVVSIFGVVSLVHTPRSNVREVAAELRSQVRPSDLVILAPEWYAASFNHYFAPSVTQIDFPHKGRSGRVDFSDVFSRISDPKPLAFVRGKIAEASREGRRVWLVSGRHYVRKVTDRDVVEATVYRQAPKFSVIRVQQIRDALRAEYGEPDTSLFIHGQTPRDDDVLPFLYSPKSKTIGEQSSLIKR